MAVDTVGTRTVRAFAFVALLCGALTVAVEAAPRMESLNFQVEPKSEDCLYQDIDVSSRVKTNVLVTRGGKLDIKYKVTGPDRIVLHEKMIFSNVDDATGQVTSTIMKKSFDFVAHQSGTFAFCFNNQMSRWTAKVVDMEVIVQPPRKEDQGAIAEDEPGKPSPVGGMEKRVVYIDRMLDKVVNEQIYHRRREEANRRTADSNNARVMWFSILEALVLVGASSLQLYIVRTWFPMKLQQSGV